MWWAHEPLTLAMFTHFVAFCVEYMRMIWWVSHLHSHLQLFSSEQ